MFISPSRLSHLLAPRDYWSEEAHDVERERVLSKTWHVVATTSELKKPGDFVTRILLGTPIQIRNFDGQIRAFANVCAHRHALMCSDRNGNSSVMRCQYHGWEYQADGSTGRIPQPKNFVPFDQPRPCLPQYSVETVGQLVLVNLSTTCPPLCKFFGDDFYAFLQERFGGQWTLALKWCPDYPVNWKIPIENSLEAYHVPAVHPNTFREDPGDARSEHVLLDHRTAFGTSLPFSPHSRMDATFQRLEGRVMRTLGHEPTGTYWQHHVFPNLLFSFTDAISLCNCVVPTGPMACSATVFQFGRMPRVQGQFRSLWAKLWARLTASITKRVLLEDLQIFTAIQTGLRASTQPGVLGRCEERIHRFQEYMTQRTSVAKS